MIMFYRGKIQVVKLKKNKRMFNPKSVIMVTAGAHGGQCSWGETHGGLQRYCM